MTRVLITGANGFIGTAAARSLAASGWEVRAAVRREISFNEYGQVDVAVVGDLGPATEWVDALSGIHSILHLAARVHLLRDSAVDPIAEFRQVNVAGTLNLARQAVAAGVKRFVFMSSIKVNGEQTVNARPYCADDVPAPVDPYGVSKHEAELGLRELARETGLELVILRPVLVYGAGVKANFRSMMRWLHNGIPLPLGAVHNRRSLVALDNLVDLIVTCLQHPAAADQIFLVSDGDDLSTTQLLRRLGQALGRPARLLSMPPAVLLAAAALLGKRDIVQRVCGSLQVDISKTRELLGWSPPISVDEGLRRAAQGFLDGTNI